MNRSKRLTILIAIPAALLVLMGCGLVSPAVRLLSRPAAIATPRVVERLVVVTPATAAGAEPANQVQTAPPISINIQPGDDTETQILKAVYHKVNPSVVYIENLTTLQDTQGQGATVPESEGSGFVWDSDGHIVTNDHVVRGATELRVTFSDGVVLPADLVGTDPDSDLAVIQVDPGLVNLVPVERGNINEVEAGQRAVAIGNPFGFAGTMTSGIVSAVGRSIPAITGFSIPMAIQTDAPINPGNSGGPLLNERGQVIGVNAQIRSDTRANSGVGFAIPVNIVERVAPALIADGVYHHSFLGVSGQTYSPAWAEATGFLRTARGAYVISVTAGGPASKGGLRAGKQNTDIVLGPGETGLEYLRAGGDLITAIDDKPIAGFDDLLVYLESFKSPGEAVKLTVQRAGEGQIDLTITLGERPRRVQ